MNLTRKPSGKDQVKHIAATLPSGQKIANIYCDGLTDFGTYEMNQKEVEQILTISKNFLLFYDNLTE